MPVDPAQLAVSAGNAALAVPPQQAADLQNNAALQNIVQGGAQQLNPSLAPQAPGKPTSKLKAVLSNFFTGFALANGMPQAQEEVQQRKAQTAEAQANVPLIQQQTEAAKIQNALMQRRLQMIQQMQTGNLGQDVIAPLGDLAPHEQATISAARAEAAMKGDMSPVFDAVKQIGNQRAIWGRSAAQGKFTMATVTPDMVAAGVPRQLLGQEMPLDQIQRLTGRSVFSNRTVMGANGPAIVNTNPMSPDFGKTVNLGLGNPGVATAGARAALTPVVVPDGQGGFQTISAAQAIASGTPKVSTPNATQIMGKQALIDDIHGGIDQLKASASILDNPGSKTKIAVALATPGITTQNFLQQPILNSMTPEEQNYAIQLLSLKEQAMAMRSVLGAGQGSEDLRRAIQQTIPNASTPNSGYAIRQLDQFATTLDRLAKGVPKLSNQGGAKGGNKPAGITIKRDANGRIVGIE